MTYILDTTALSELTKPRPNSGFLAWLSRHSSNEAFISAPSVGELEAGIALLEQSKKRTNLERWLSKLVRDFEDRVLPFDLVSARIWGRAIGAARRAGRPLPLVDSQIAAIAKAHGLTVVTRNVRHFEVGELHDVDVVNPWSG